MLGIACSPDSPEPVDVGVMQPEDRVQSGGVETAHPAADLHMHGAVRNTLQLTWGAAAMVENRLGPSERRIAAIRCAGKVWIDQRFRQGYLFIAGNDAP